MDLNNVMKLIETLATKNLENIQKIAQIMQPNTQKGQLIYKKLKDRLISIRATPQRND